MCVYTCSNTLLIHACLLIMFVCDQDLESKALVDELNVDRLSTPAPVECVSLAWSNDGQTLFAGKVFDEGVCYTLHLSMNTHTHTHTHTQDIQMD